MNASSVQSNRTSGGANSGGWLPALGVSLGTALLVVVPFFWLGNASGHDFAFHAASWQEAAGQWKEGILYPRWAEWANWGFGEPRFVFYPPLSWMLGAALGLVLPWNAVPGVFIVLAQTVAGVCSFALVRKYLPVRGALVGAAAYAANPYALLIVYMRSDFAEQLACALMPVVVLAALELCVLAHRERSLPRATVFFAVVFAAVWLSNAPAAVMASYSVALIFLWAAAREKSLRPLLRGAAVLALGFGLTGFYLLSAAYEQRWVNIGQVLSSGLLPAQNFLYTLIDDPEHNVFNWIASSVAVLLIVMTGTAGIAAHRAMSDEVGDEEKKKLWQALMLLSGAATVLMLGPSAFLWEHLPKLRYMQFPWRWMAILAVPCSYFLAKAISRQRFGWLWAVLLLAVTAGTATFLVHSAWWDSDDIPALQEAIANNHGFEGTDEYDPLGDDHTNLPQQAPRVKILPADDSEASAPEAKIDIQRWTAEEKIVTVTSSKPARVALRLLNYPAWRVEVSNGGTANPQRLEEPGPTVIQVPAGMSGIRILLGRTRDRAVGILLSALSCFAAVLLLLWPQS